MKAVLTTAHGGPEVLQLRRDFPAPTPAPGEALVRVAATAVNFHDIFTRRGMPGVKIKLPVIVGSDIAGTVESVGQSVDAQWLGKRVLIDPVMREGDRFGMLGETVDGGRAELVVVQQSMLLEIPAGVGFEHAAALPLAYGTAYRMLITRGKLEAGERIMVLGASGGVGVACVQLARMVGAEVLAFTSSQAKMHRLKEIGASHVANYVDKPFLETVKDIYGKPRITGTGGVDVAVNFTGGDTLPATQKCVKANGRILCCGATAGYNLTLDARYWWTYEHTLIGSDGWHKDDLKVLLDLVASGRLVPVIDKVLPLEETAEGERLLEDREVVGKVLLKP
ncbi:MAG TPA: zinc-binding dehydrogenase [Steroidobacteraceae bacterium]|nr:zinc-binding dehydrogenase [Steroidobacteraceae bacterium]